MKTLFAASAAKTLEAAPCFLDILKFAARLLGNFAPCEARPEALPLDSAAFEKAGETFNLRSAENLT